MGNCRVGFYTYISFYYVFKHKYIYICKCIIKEMDMSLGNSTHEEIKDKMMRWMMVRFFSGMRDE